MTLTPLLPLPKRRWIHGITMFLVCVSPLFVAGAFVETISNGAFTPKIWLLTVNRKTRPRAIVVFPLAMAMPGKSENQIKMEREQEIFRKLAKLKSEGKMVNKDGTKSAEDSAMIEAEAFFNRESPLRKFERKMAERKRLAEEAEELKRSINDVDENVP